eukprot:COSAG02_NODE_47316_length_342_cov_0.691358_1_plen_79_part_10
MTPSECDAVCYRYAITLEVVVSHGSLALFHSSEFPDGGRAGAWELALLAERSLLPHSISSLRVHQPRHTSHLESSQHRL